jgi:hypothetical protein
MGRGEGYEHDADPMAGRTMNPPPRRESKPEIPIPKKVSFAGSHDAIRATGWIVRLSIVGVEIESLQPPPVGSQAVVRGELIAGEGELVLRGRVQWTTAKRFAIQFGPLGARETNAILRAAEPSSRRAGSGAEAG